MDDIVQSFCWVNVKTYRIACANLNKVVNRYSLENNKILLQNFIGSFHINKPVVK